MEVPTISIDREEARRRVQEFTAKRRRKLTEMDHALMKGYRAMAEGLALIDVNEAVKQGGQFEGNNCPHIALARADLKTLYFDHTMVYDDEDARRLAGIFCAWERRNWERDPVCKAFRGTPEANEQGLHRASISQGLLIELEPGTLQPPAEPFTAASRWFKQTYAATVPDIPFHLRPEGDISNYFILWEVAEWRSVYQPPRAPADPLLLERIAHPVYVVVAQWDLTELEQRILEAFRGRP